MYATGAILVASSLVAGVVALLAGAWWRAAEAFAGTLVIAWLAAGVAGRLGWPLPAAVQRWVPLLDR